MESMESTTWMEASWYAVIALCPVSLNLMGFWHCCKVALKAAMPGITAEVEEQGGKLTWGQMGENRAWL